jgi:hypothetical protein
MRSHILANNGFQRNAKVALNEPEIFSQGIVKTISKGTDQNIITAWMHPIRQQSDHPTSFGIDPKGSPGKPQMTHRFFRKIIPKRRSITAWGIPTGSPITI